MAEPGPEPGRAWRVFALCGAAVFLAAVAAGAALLAWNLAASASRRPRCPEPGANTTAPPGDLEPEVEELRCRLAEAAQRKEALTRQLNQAEGVRQELEEALRACEGRQSRLQTQLMTLKTEMDEAKAQGTQMGAENGALTEALARWEAAATESAQRLDAVQRRASAAEAESEACAVREAALREHLRPGSPDGPPAQSATPPDPLRVPTSAQPPLALSPGNLRGLQATSAARKGTVDGNCVIVTHPWSSLLSIPLPRSPRILSALTPWG
ncbi:coiled-coil domain-containing protein 194 [Phocoena sinus]|uniref:coiled-coil domain-containing protein 194 n=1 Tax=Phocoena sinus TaxID=42100 RepID=UPI0013C51613|nr:coiled-coil domain-containing protein 194 [Phocoena sinus]